MRQRERHLSALRHADDTDRLPPLLGNERVLQLDKGDVIRLAYGLHVGQSGGKSVTFPIDLEVGTCIPVPDLRARFILYTVARMNFRELRSRNGHKAGGVVQAVEGDANVNRHQGRSRHEIFLKLGVSGLKRRSRGVAIRSQQTASWRVYTLWTASIGGGK